MLLHAHSGLRYLVLLMGLVVVAYAAYGLATKAEYGKRMRVLSAIFTGVIDLTLPSGHRWTPPLTSPSKSLRRRSSSPANS